MGKGAIIMPYIEEKRRQSIDKCINYSVECMKVNIGKAYIQEISNDDFLNMSGDINYFTSRLINQLAGEMSYSKICVITGVLENIKQEFYRRIASPYEDKKIVENGDIKEYK